MLISAPNVWHVVGYDTQDLKRFDTHLFASCTQDPREHSATLIECLCERHQREHVGHECHDALRNVNPMSDLRGNPSYIPIPGSLLNIYPHVARKVTRTPL